MSDFLDPIPLHCFINCTRLTLSFEMFSFDPSRWENPTKEMKHVFMPFGGGSRSKSSFIFVYYSD